MCTLESERPGLTPAVATPSCVTVNKSLSLEAELLLWEGKKETCFLESWEERDAGCNPWAGTEYSVRILPPCDDKFSYL